MKHRKEERDHLLGMSKRLTLIPADRHLPTASGTAARGGSIMDMRPTKQRLSVWKLTSSVSKAKPLGYLSSGRNMWQKPGGIREEETRTNEFYIQEFVHIFLIVQTGQYYTLRYRIYQNYIANL